MDRFKNLLIPLFIFILVTALYFAVSPGETSFDYFSRLSQSFVNGKLYIEENPPWLNELVPVGNKYYVVYPPMPSVLMLPVALFAKPSQTIFSIIIGGMNAVLVYFLILKLTGSKKTGILISAFFALGTNHWYLASIGSSWFMAHVVSIFFLLLALLESFTKKRLLLVGILLGASFWARTPVIFTLFFFWIYFHKKFWPLNVRSLLNFYALNLGLAIFVLLDGYYNFLRFGQFSPFAPYNLIPGLENDPVFKDGFMSIKFIPRHLEAIFTKLPEFKSTYPYMFPSLYSTAVWFTSPWLIYIFLAPVRKLLTWASWAGVIFPLFIVILWAGVGYAQFGYRFFQDFMPFLLILAAMGLRRIPLKFAYALLIFSVAINAWGTIVINKLGYSNF